MPTYEYRCAKCGQHTEVFQSFSEAPLTKHQGCGGKLAKVLSPAGIVLKGSGFYKTDSRSGTKKTAASSETASDSKRESKSDATVKSESKSSDSSSTSSSSSSSDAKSA
jgi:putative FmdB family regulatory protein